MVPYNAIPPLLLIAFVGPFGTGLVLQLVIVGLSDGIERCKAYIVSTQFFHWLSPVLRCSRFVI